METREAKAMLKTLAPRKYLLHREHLPGIRTTALQGALLCVVLGRSVVSDSSRPHRLAGQALLSMQILKARTLQWVAIPPGGNLSNPGIKPRPPAGGFFTS